MRPSDERLIERLQARNADRARATVGGDGPRKAVPPVAAKALQSSECAIGFEFPELLRAIYLKVGNGGFGPEYGIVGTKGGAKLDGCTLETCYRGMAKLTRENRLWHWPERLLPLASYGCGMWSCIDCADQKLPMILWDPNDLDEDLTDADAQLNWGNSFWDQKRTFKTWLEDWLVDKLQPEPTWPSDAWIRKRLGFTLPK